MLLGKPGRVFSLGFLGTWLSEDPDIYGGAALGVGGLESGATAISKPYLCYVPLTIPQQFRATRNRGWKNSAGRQASEEGDLPNYSRKRICFSTAHLRAPHSNTLNSRQNRARATERTNG